LTDVKTRAREALWHPRTVRVWPSALPLPTDKVMNVTGLLEVSKQCAVDSLLPSRHDRGGAPCEPSRRAARGLERGGRPMATTEPASAPTERAAVTSERLIDAAFELFVETGFEGAKVQDIAQRAGYTTGAIYGRFGSKTSLLAAAIAARGASFLEGALGN